MDLCFRLAEIGGTVWYEPSSRDLGPRPSLLATATVEAERATVREGTALHSRTAPSPRTSTGFPTVQ